MNSFGSVVACFLFVLAPSSQAAVSPHGVVPTRQGAANGQAQETSALGRGDAITTVGCKPSVRWTLTSSSTACDANITSVVVGGHRSVLTTKSGAPITGLTTLDALGEDGLQLATQGLSPTQSSTENILADGRASFSSTWISGGTVRKVELEQKGTESAADFAKRCKEMDKAMKKEFPPDAPSQLVMFPDDSTWDPLDVSWWSADPAASRGSPTSVPTLYHLHAERIPGESDVHWNFRAQQLMVAFGHEFPIV